MRCGLRRGMLGAAALLAPWPAVTANGLGAGEIGWELRQEMERPLDARVRDLLQTADAEGRHNVRGSYLHRFEPVGEDTYEVVFHTRTAQPEELLVTRSRLTLSRAKGDRWTISAERVEQEISGLFYRRVPGDETFHRFDAFDFTAEGLSVSSGPGTMYVDYDGGLPYAMVLRAEGLRYAYRPPPDLPFAETHIAFLKRFGGWVTFEPEEVTLRCDSSDCQSLLSQCFRGLGDASPETIDPELARSYRDASRKTEERRREDPMTGFGPLLAPDRRRWSVTIKQRGKDNEVRLAYDNAEPREVEYRASGFGVIYSYPSAETRASGIAPIELERRDGPERRSYDVVSLTGEMELATETPTTLSGDLTYRLRIHERTSLLWFGISQVRAFKDEQAETKDPSLRVEWIEDGSGNEITFVPFGTASGYLVLPETLEAGSELVLRVEYTHENAIYALNAYYSYVSRGGWLPFVRFGDFIDEYDLRVTTPKKFTILGVGRVAAEEEGRDTRTVRFTSDSPVQFPTVIFGRYNSDHSKIAVTRRDGSEVPVNVYVDGYSMSSAMWDIRPSALRPIGDQAANSLNLYQAILGVDYPHGKLDLVNSVFQNPFSGQSPASIVYLGGAVFRGTGIAQYLDQAGDVAHFMESVVAHEVAHQWWGGAVAQHDRHHYWFVESLAEYMAALYIENLYASKNPELGWRKYLEKIESWRRNILAADLMASVQDSETVWQGSAPGLSRKTLVYDYGPYVFHMLRMTFRDYRGGEGDDKFFGFLAELASRLQGKEIVTRDIQQIAESAFGGTDEHGAYYTVDLEWFFDQWIRGVGIPQFELDYGIRRSEDGSFVVEGQVLQQVAVGSDREVIEGRSFRGLAVISAKSANDQIFNVPLTIDGAATSFRFRLPVKPSEVVLNRNGEILSDDVTTVRTH